LVVSASFAIENAFIFGGTRTKIYQGQNMQIAFGANNKKVIRLAGENE
jgi:hypothetical protein